jgi:hypothetical protein
MESDLFTCPIPEPDQPRPHHPTPSYLSKINRNIIHPPVSYRVHRRTISVPILSQTNAVYITPSHLSKIHLISSTNSHIHTLWLRSFTWRIHQSLRFIEKFCNNLILYDEGFSVPHSIPKLEDRPLSSFCCCLFNAFAATLHSWRPPLLPQAKDAQCCCDRGPPNMEM